MQTAKEQIKFPLTSEWIAEFKKDWFRDNDSLPDDRRNDLWAETERVCRMVYSYQRRVFEQNNAAILSLLSQQEVVVESDEIWQIGNTLRITTVYDWEVRDKTAEGGYRNEGKQVYEGEVIEVDKGLALKTDIAIFKTQGTYWFGSILRQKVELIHIRQQLSQQQQQRQYSEEDMKSAFNAGEMYWNFNEWLNEQYNNLPK